jgi:hypothetical protein
MDSKLRQSGDSTAVEQHEKIADQQATDPLHDTVPPAELDRILRKVDIRVIPILAILYLLSFLDRGESSNSSHHPVVHSLRYKGSIGNANIQGLSETLGLIGQQYNWLVQSKYLQPGD